MTDIPAAPVSAIPAARVPLVDLQGVRQVYRPSEKSEHVVLDGVSLQVNSGEIVCLLGRSGSGKSTLLRIVSGLLTPTSGSVRWCGQPVTGPYPGMAMVFQSFALFPWLTVLDNVQLGLQALGVDEAQGRERALRAIELIGLGGFESAYPRELSGGMRQRVGFARALVVDPKLLLMDEPFSALDVLTAETLRDDIIELWSSDQLPIQSVLMVTHNIEEAVLMGSRLLVLSSNPGRVTTEIRVDLARPRNRTDPAFRALVDDIYALMTESAPFNARGRQPVQPSADPGLALTPVSTSRLTGLLEHLAAGPYHGRADLPELVAHLQMPANELFAAIEVLQLLRFVVALEGDVQLTDGGYRFVRADGDVRKQLFGRQLIAGVPLAALICRVLTERPNHRAPRLRFLEELEDTMSAGRAAEALRAVIAWGRYGELFDYDEHAQEFSLQNPG